MKKIYLKLMALALLSVLSVTNAWATGEYTFKKGTTIYYDFTAVSGGVNWHDGSSMQYDGSGGGTIKVVTFASDVEMNSSWWIAQTETGGWDGITFSTTPTSGQNVIKIASTGKSYTWGTTTFAIAMDKDNWDTDANKSTTGSVDITLNASTTYAFKVVYKGVAEKWCGMSSSWVSSSISDYNLSWNGGDNIYLMTAGAGTYTFTYDFTNNQISITYPTANHPSINYCYLYNYTWDNTYLQLYTSDDANYPTKGWPGQQLHSPATTTIGSTPVYFCAMGSNYTEIQFDDNSGNYTGYQNTSSCWGKYMYYNTSTSTWEWTAFTVRITLNNQDALTTGTEYKDVRFNDEALTTSITKPTKTGYTFGGYYTATAGGGSQIIDANGAWVASVSGYTDASKKWIKEGGTATLYAKWTINSYTLTWNLNGGTVTTAGTQAAAGATGSPSGSVTYGTSLTAPVVAKTGYTFNVWSPSVASTMPAVNTTYGATWTANQTTVTLKANTSHHGSGTDKSVTATYDSELPSFTHTSAATGYHLAGYYTGETDGTLVISSEGAFASNDGVWNRTDGSTLTLWAHYEPNTYAINLDDRSATSAVSPSSVTATYDANSLSASISNPSKSGYTFAGWYLDDDTNTGCGTSQLINTSGTLNASVSPYTDASRNWVNDGGTTVYARWKANASVSAYNFQYGSGTYYSNSWTIVNFGAADANNMRTADFTMVAPTSKKFYVGYDGDYQGSPLGSGSATSDEVDLSDLRLAPGSATIGIATGATGKLVIYDNSDAANLYVGFLPSGYAVNYNGKTKAFHATATENLYETDVITIAEEDLDEAIRFKVQLATSSSYVDCGVTASEELADVGNYAKMADGVKGRFYIWINSSDDNFALSFNTCENWFASGETTAGDWSDASKWSLGNLPTLDDVVYLQKAVNVDIAHATAKSIVIDQNGKTGKLTIQSNMGLEVAGTITRTTDGSNSLATRPEDLILQSSSAGNASLVFDNSDEENLNQATVQMYSPASISGDWNWQFMGIPFTSANALYSYYDAYLYEWKSSGWDVVPNGNSMTPFTGYCITQNDPTTYVMEGTLNPNSDVEITIPASKEFVMANSWSAPISVCNFTSTTLPLATKTIYLFNTGHAESAASEGVAAGTYIAMPINSAVYTGNYLIAPMEGFYVDNTSGLEATITLKYNELVRPSGSHTDIVAGPMHAPKRIAAEADPAVMKIKATGSRYSDRVVILAREDFSTGFDNGWDGKNINEPGVAPIIYALRADGTKDAVSAIPTYEGTVVGFRQGEDNQYTFSFEYDGDEILYLNDLKQRAATLIDAEHTYTFTSAAGDAEARFTISATPIEKMPTGVDEIESGINVHKQMINGTLYIIRDGRIYNAEGALVK